MAHFRRHLLQVEGNDHLKFFPTCAVTRAQSRAEQETLEAKKRSASPTVQFPLLAFPLSVSPADLKQEQQGDPALSKAIPAAMYRKRWKAWHTATFCRKVFW